MADPQNAQGNTVVVYAPDGTPHDIPEEQLHDAVKLGKGTPAVWMERPGEPGNKYPIPADQVNNAVKSGGKVLPFEQQDVKHPGLWSTLYDEATSLGKSILTAGPTSGTGPTAADIAYEDKLKAEGHGKAYRLMMSLTPEAMRESAESGDVAGVAGHAIGQALPVLPSAAGLAAGRGIPDLTPKAAEFNAKLSNALTAMTPKQAGQVVGGVTGAGLGHGTLSAPGAYYGAKGAGSMVESVLGKERANAPIITPKPQPAPFPETPPREVLQANPLTNAGRTVAEPAEALSRVPQLAAASAPTTFGGSTFRPSSIADAPPRVVLQAVDELGPNATHDQIVQRVQEIETKLSPAEQKVVAEGAKQGLFKQPAAKQYVHPNVENFGLDLTKAPEKPIDTDAYAKATAQARTELGERASKENVFARRDEILSEQGVEAPKGDIGEQSRKDIKGPTREETRAAAAAREGQTLSQYPPPAPEIKLQPTKPTPQDVAETANIREQVRQAAEREGRSALREARGEYAQRNDVSVPKGTMTGVAGEGNDVSLVDRSTAKQPEVTQLPDIEDIPQAVRQLANLQKAGASKNAIAEFERRAEVRFGPNWKHIAGQVDALRQIRQKSTENFPQNP